MKVVADLSLTSARRAGRLWYDAWRAPSGIRPALVLDFVAGVGGIVPAGTAPLALVSCQRASTGLCRSAAGVLTTAAVDTLRIDYDRSTGACRGLLVEGSRTNTAALNASPTSLANVNLAQSGTGATLTLVSDAAALAAAGLSGINTGGNVYKIDATAATANSWLIVQSSNFDDTAANWSMSAFVRGSGTMNLRTGFASNSEPYIALTSAYQRLARNTANNASGIHNVNSPMWVHVNPGAVVYVTLIQIEQGDYVSSYIPTAGSPVTRAADAVWRTLGAEVAAGAGTVLTEHELARVSTATPRVASISDGGEANEVARLQHTAAGGLSARTVAAAAIQSNIATAAAVTAGAHRMAYAWATDDFALAVDGAIAGSDSGGSLPSGMTRLSIGASPAGASQLHGWIRRLVYWPARLSNADLQALTA